MNRLFDSAGKTDLLVFNQGVIAITNMKFIPPEPVLLEENWKLVCQVRRLFNLCLEHWRKRLFLTDVMHTAIRVDMKTIF